MIREIMTSLNAFEIFTIFKDDSHSFILDSAMDSNRLGRYSFISSNPFKILKYKDSQGNPFEDLKVEFSKYKKENNTHLPFVGGAVGYLSYDLCHYVEKLPRRSIDDVKIPDLYFGFYNWVIVVDHLENKTYIASPDVDELEEKEIVENIANRIHECEKSGIDPICYEQKEYPKTKLKSNFTKQNYINAVEKVREYIKSGDIYQANLTQRFEGKVSMNSYELYRDLRTFSPAPF